MHRRSNAGSGGATATCPTGTTDDGIVATFRICRLPQLVATSLTLPKIAGVVYRFRGQTEVGVDVGTTGADSGVTLTIAPGVVLAADSSESSNDLILVNRGARINAVGTVDNPIVFTAQQNLAANGVSDATQGPVGRHRPARPRAYRGLRDRHRSEQRRRHSPTCQNPIEGVTGRFYGGPSSSDNSGTMQYVQIRYTGIAISEGNELQGLTLGGTGSGTTLDHIQSHNSADDGVEIFGGSTNLKYMAMTGADDDGFDVDNGYRGLHAVHHRCAEGGRRDRGQLLDGDRFERRRGPVAAHVRHVRQLHLYPDRDCAGGDPPTRRRRFRFVNGVVKSPSASPA